MNKKIYPTYTFFNNITDVCDGPTIAKDKRWVQRLSLISFVSSLITNAGYWFYIQNSLGKTLKFSDIILTMMAHSLIGTMLLWLLIQSYRKCAIMSSGRDIVYSDSSTRLSTEVDIGNTMFLGLLLGFLALIASAFSVVCFLLVLVVLNFEHSISSALLSISLIMVFLFSIVGHFLHLRNRRKMETKWTIEGANQ